MEYPVVTMRQALDDGMEGWQLRAIANSLVRIARFGYSLEEGAYDRNTCFSAARRLRVVAKKVDSFRRNGVWITTKTGGLNA